VLQLHNLPASAPSVGMLGPIILWPKKDVGWRRHRDSKYSKISKTPFRGTWSVRQPGVKAF
jgi:hypothetical protein